VALLKLKDAFDRGLAFQTVFFSAAIKADTEYLGMHAISLVFSIY
jgi:hypothetical protein